MIKEEFKRELRERLRQVPRDDRKMWKDTDLFIWWGKTKEDDSYLRWDNCPGNDVWQFIPGMCRDLIGPNAS